MAISRFKTSTLAQGLPKYQKLWDGTSAVITNSFESIATVTLTSAASNVSFSSIPSTYKHLQLRITARSTLAIAGGQSQMRINGDTGSNYTYHNINANGSSQSADGNGSMPWAYGLDRFAGGSDTANVFGSAIIDFFHYADTNKYKTIRSSTGYDANGSGYIRLASSLWTSTSAITSIYFEIQGGSGNYAAGTKFALYGIKG